MVRGVHTWRWSYHNYLVNALTHQQMRYRVVQDLKNCVTARGAWNQSDYCMNLRSDLPPYKTENFDLKDSIFSHSPYDFLGKKGDANQKALRISYKTTFRDLGFNLKLGEEQLFYELTYVPIPLDPFITQVGEYFNLVMEGLTPPSYSQYNLHQSMTLKTSHGIGTGKDIYVSKVRENGIAQNTKPPENYSLQGATWYQRNVDAVLPWMRSRDSAEQGNLDATKGTGSLALCLASGSKGSQIQKFLITFKAGETFGCSKNPLDDPIFGAHQEYFDFAGSRTYLPDREVTAIGCTEVFKTCLTGQCVDNTKFVRTGNSMAGNQHEEFFHLFYPGIMSVWADIVIEPIYESRSNTVFGIGRNWQEDIGERFLRSQLRVRYVSRYAAEEALTRRGNVLENPWVMLLYRCSDYTNVNIWGTVATAVTYLYIIFASCWFVLLSPLVVPIKFLYSAISLGYEKLTDLIGGKGVHIFNDNLYTHFALFLSCMLRVARGRESRSDGAYELS